MNRRDAIRALAAIGLGGLAGCSGILGDLTRKRLLEYGTFATVDGFRVTTTGVLQFRQVSYRGAGDETLVWNPGPEKAIAVASYLAERLDASRGSWPRWADFRLVTSSGVITPRSDTSDGTSVYHITSPAGARVSRPDPKGVEGAFRREWDAVYVIDREETGSLTTKWVGPAEPYFWMAPGR